MKIIKKVVKRSRRLAEKILYSFIVMLMVLQPVSAPGILRAYAADEATAEVVLSPATDLVSAPKEEPKKQEQSEPEVAPKEDPNQEATPEVEKAETETKTETETEALEANNEQTTPESASVTSSENQSSVENNPKEEAKKEIWSVDGNKATTNDPVELGKKYVAPQNDQVTVTFTKLPDKPGILSIEEITLTDKQVAQLGALSNKAYDITSDMKDGTFKYELTLPKPKNEENVQIKFAEDIARIEKAETVPSDEVKTKNSSVNATLDHFTIYVVTGNSFDGTGVATSIGLYEATLNGFNGDEGDASKTSFWWGTTDPGSVTDVAQFGGLVGWDRGPSDEGAVSKEAPFSKTITGLIPDTKYYFIAWSMVGGDWHPGEVKNFTTLAIPVPNIVSPADGASVKPAGLILDWSDITEGNGPITYYYQSSYSSAVDASNANALASTIYTSGALSNSQINASGSADNTYYWQVRACDASSNCSDWSGPWEVTVDSIAPNAPSLISPSDSAVVSGNPNESWSSISDADHYFYESYSDVSGTNPLYNTDVSGTSRTVGGMQTITFYWRVKAVDAAGNESPWSEMRELTIDNTAPTVEITSPTVSLLKGTVGVRGTVIDENPHHYWLNITRNGSQVVNKTVNESASFTDELLYTLTQDGNYVVTLAARDAAGGTATSGNRSANIIKSFTIDNTAPQTTIDSSPIDPTNSTDAVFTFSGYDGSGSGVASFECQIDGGGFSACTSGDDFGPLSDGSHTFDVRAIDNAGNVDATPASYTWTVDTVAPSSVITTFGLSDGGSIVTPTWNGLVEGTASDNLSGVNHVKLEIAHTDFGLVTPEYWNGSAWQAGATTFNAVGDTVWNYQLPDVVAEGTYQVTSHAVDNAGNEESTYSITIIYDKTIPEVTLSIDPNSPNGDNNWYTEKPIITLTANDNYNVDHIEYQLNGTSGAWIVYSGPVKIDNGEWKFYYRSVDAAYNVSSIGLKNVKVDTEDPDNVKNFEAKYDGTNNDVKLSWDAKDNDIAKVYIYRGKSKNFSTNSSTLISKQDDKDENYTDKNRTPGEKYYYKIIARDDAGNRSNTKIISIEIPIEEGVSAVSVDEGTTPTPNEDNTEGQEEGNNQEEGNGQEGKVLGEENSTGDSNVLGEEDEKSEESSIFNKWPWLLLIVIILAGFWYLFGKRKKKNKRPEIK